MGGFQMFTDFLWLLGAKQQHDRQKELGLAGLGGLLLVFLMVWKWDSIFFPLFNKLGFVGFAERIGLISELPVMTVLNILAVIFVLCLFLTISAFLITVVGCSLLVFGSSAAGKKVLGVAAFVFFFPIILIFMVVVQYRYSTSPEGKASMRNTYKRDPNLKPLLKRYHDESEASRMHLLYIKQVYRREKEKTFEFQPVDAKFHLNRAVASIKTDRGWLIGYDSSDMQWYVLFPNPLPVFASQAAERNNLKEAIANFPKYHLKDYFVDVKDGFNEDFYVPALPIHFSWNKSELKIEPVIYDNAKLTSKNTKNMYNYRIQTEEITSLFDIIAERKDLFEKNRYLHVFLYLVPIAYPPGVPFEAEERFNGAVKRIPYSDTYYPIYAADVRESVTHFAEARKEWAINWFMEPV